MQCTADVQIKRTVLDDSPYTIDSFAYAIFHHENFHKTFREDSISKTSACQGRLPGPVGPEHEPKGFWERLSEANEGKDEHIAQSVQTFDQHANAFSESPHCGVFLEEDLAPLIR